MPKLEKQRQLKFESLNDIKNELHSLLEKGYTQSGNWNLAQSCLHLNEWMRYPMDGFPKPPWFVRAIFSVMRMTGMAKRIANGIFEKGFSTGMMTAPDTAYKPDHETDKNAVEELCKTIDRFESYDGTLHPSPLFGELDIEKARKVQYLHCAHHLEFLKPKE